jgi:hypothetical protein
VKLNATVSAALPPLAWLLELENAPERHRLLCGTGVVLAETAFFEGAWPGTLAAMDFAEQPETFGSGGVLTPEGWAVVPPSHTLESVFCCSDGAKLFVSNALPFLLAHRGDALDPRFLDYHRIFFDILGGLDHSPIRFPSQRCAEIRGYYYENLRIGRDLGVTVQPKPQAPRFAGFADYRTYLARTVRAVLDNAADHARRNPYRPLATISQGYDSPACAALAREAGCRAAVTHGYARRAFGVIDSDSGAEIAQALGLAVTVADRTAYLEREGPAAPEAEFLSHGLEGTDVNYLAFAPQMQHCVLFTGCHGDTMWDKDKVPSAVIERGDLDGGSLGEYRRRLDFIHLPLPYIGALRHPDVVAISNAAEMAAYSIGGDYDRPIPRRILEEAGVPRNAFGQAKKATSISFFGFLPGMRERLSPSSRRALEAFAATWRIGPGARLRLRRNEAVAILVDFLRVVEKKTHLAHRLGLESRLEKILHVLDTESLDTPRAVLALHWSMAEMIKRYAVPIEAAQPETVAAPAFTGAVPGG